MTTPPDMQKKIEEVALACAKQLPKGNRGSGEPCGDWEDRKWKLHADKIADALTTITQPLLERIGELEQNQRTFCSKCGLETNGAGHICSGQLTPTSTFKLATSLSDCQNELLAARQQLTTLQAKVKEMKERGDNLARDDYGTRAEFEQAIIEWRDVTKDL